MDRKTLNHITGIFLTVTVLAIVVMLLGTLRRPTRISLPGTGQNTGTEPGDAAGGDALTVIQVTPETVQAAVSTLFRPSDYSRIVTVEQFWGSGSGTYTASVAVSGGWTRTDRTLSGGRIRHSLTDGETTYIWYDNETAFYTAQAGGISDDQEQTIPTYEDILALPVEAIAAADYRTLSDIRCIYVETAEDEAGYSLRYWVSVDTGLLAAAERLLGEEVVYRMAAPGAEQAAPDAANFTLPDGTVLI